MKKSNKICDAAMVRKDRKLSSIETLTRMSLLATAPRENELLDKRYKKFEAYKKCTSTCTAVLDCFRPIVFTLLVALSALLLPLAPIENGVLSNGALPSFTFVGSTASTYLLIVYLKCSFPLLEISRKKQAFICITGGLYVMMIVIILAETWCYPFPFTLIVGSISFVPIITIIAFFVLWKDITKQPKYKSGLKVLLVLLNVVIAIILIYPFIIHMYFSNQDPNSILDEIVVASALLGTRQTLKEIILRQKLPVYIAAYTCNAFHTIYIATTLQAQDTLFMLLFLMTVNTISNLYGFYLLLQAKVAKEGSVTEQCREMWARSEDLILVEYLEVVVPIIFACLKIFYYFHPNRQYISLYKEELNGLDELFDALVPFLLYALIELFWFIWFSMWTQWQLKISILMQLGYLSKHLCIPLEARCSNLDMTGALNLTGNANLAFEYSLVETDDHSICISHRAKQEL